MRICSPGGGDRPPICPGLGPSRDRPIEPSLCVRRKGGRWLRRRPHRTGNRPDDRGGTPAEDQAAARKAAVRRGEGGNGGGDPPRAGIMGSEQGSRTLLSHLPRRSTRHAALRKSREKSWRAISTHGRCSRLAIVRLVRRKSFGIGEDDGFRRPRKRSSRIQATARRWASSLVDTPFCATRSGPANGLRGRC